MILANRKNFLNKNMYKKSNLKILILLNILKNEKIFDIKTLFKKLILIIYDLIKCSKKE